MPRRHAFSLIELLVSISIIAVLLGIILAALPKVRQAGLKAACGANLHGLGQGIEAYKMDNDAKFPSARYMPAPLLSGDTDPALNVALADYIEPNNPAYRCPGDPTIYDLEWTDDQGVTHQCGMSYSYESAALSGRTFEESFYARFLQRNTTNTPVAHDFDGGTVELQDGRTIRVDFYHKERNVLFVDGHVGNVVAPPESKTQPPAPGA